MTRIKKGISYFDIDCHFESDVAIRRLVARCGAQAKLAYIETCLHAYRDYGYYLPLNDADLEIIAYDCGLELADYNTILKHMLEVGLFVTKSSSDQMVITSKRMQQTFRAARGYKAKIDENYRILPDDQNGGQNALPDTQKEDKIPYEGENCGENALPDTQKEEKSPDKVDKIRVEKSREEQRDIVGQAIRHLNAKTGKDFKPSSSATKRHIQARINDGYTLDDLIAVIDLKTKQWLNDKKMAPYLRPETLFGTKFEGYLNEGRKAVCDHGFTPATVITISDDRPY
jgi:uncharacterized phage protein (TIGR02220 family)